MKQHIGLTPAKTLYDEIVSLGKAIETEKDPTKLWGLLRRKRKLQKMYDVCVTDEEHRAIINYMETLERGF